MKKLLLLLPVIAIAISCRDNVSGSGTLGAAEFKKDSDEVTSAEQSLSEVGCSFEASILTCKALASEATTVGSLDEVSKRLEQYKSKAANYLSKYSGKKVAVNGQAQDFPAQSDMILKKNIQESAAMLEKLSAKKLEIQSKSEQKAQVDAVSDEVVKLDPVTVTGNKSDADDSTEDDSK